jgi:hypothetical protein
VVALLATAPKTLKSITVKVYSIQGSIRPHKKKLVYHPRPPPFSRPPQKKFIFYFNIFHHQNRLSCIKHATGKTGLLNRRAPML